MSAAVSLWKKSARPDFTNLIKNKKNMQILLISSSPRKEKSTTFLLANQVLKGISDSNINIEVIHLSDHRINFCQHCEECHKKILHCSVTDSVPKILNKMLAAEGIILASPNYINQVTASMKALFDRSSHFIHCKRLLGKYIIGVVSSGSGKDRAVLGYIKLYAHICGAQYSGGVSSAVPLSKEKIGEAYKLGNTFITDIKERKAYAEQSEIIERGKQYFKEIIKARKNEWQEEYQYWLDKGWV